MPYITQDRRKEIDNEINQLCSKLQQTIKNEKDIPGYLNYIFTRLCSSYIGSDIKYSRLNALIGALECCKLELYRKRIAGYEDVKEQENGKVV